MNCDKDSQTYWQQYRGKVLSDKPTDPDENNIKDGYIRDYVSGLIVKETPEEREAVQVFSRVLVEDYGYPKENLHTRPQWRVKVRPSDSKKEYPIDVAVFSSQEHTDDALRIVVECKRKSRVDGLSQLKDYLRFCEAELGVWFNGEQRLFLRKIERSGKVEFEEIPNIPRYGERVEDIGKFKRRDLKPATNLKSVFRAIRNYLAANAVGITRDETFAQQIINLLFCKIYDERFTKPDDMVTFRAGIDEKPKDVAARVKALFDSVKDQYTDVISKSDDILLDANSLAYVVGELQLYAITENDRDAVADAFEIFIGPSLKGPQGQFFTPRNVVKMVIDMVNPSPKDRIIDPACGSGGFLVEALRHVWRKIDDNGAELNWPDNEIYSAKQQAAIKNFCGIDKDEFLAKVAKAYMAILGDGRGGIYCENSLEIMSKWGTDTKRDVKPESFDVVVTNPPFGKKLSIDARELLETYDLGHHWRVGDSGVFERREVQDKQPPQILFIERCLDLLKPGGTLGIVLLESIFGMPKYQYIVDYLLKRTTIKAIVTMPEDLFQPYTHAKTCVVILEKRSSDEDHSIFMADVKWCGHDSRGNPTYRVNENGERTLLDDVPEVAPIYQRGPN